MASRESYLEVEEVGCREGNVLPPRGGIHPPILSLFGSADVSLPVPFPSFPFHALHVALSIGRALSRFLLCPLKEKKGKSVWKRRFVVLVSGSIYVFKNNDGSKVHTRHSSPAAVSASH